MVDEILHQLIGSLSHYLQGFIYLGGAPFCWCIYNWVVATQILFLFPPRKLGQDEPILTSIFFQMGWFNHQLEEDLGFLAMFFFWRLVGGILIRSHGMYINHH